MALSGCNHSVFITLFLSSYTICYSSALVSSLHQIAFCPNQSASNQHRVVRTKSSLMSVDLQQSEHRRPPSYLIWHNSQEVNKEEQMQSRLWNHNQPCRNNLNHLSLFRKSPCEKKIQPCCFRLFVERSDLTDASKSVL